MKNIDWYKEKYGEEDTLHVSETGLITLPEWLIRFFLAKTGLKSKKRRIIRKMLKREISEAILRGLNGI